MASKINYKDFAIVCKEINKTNGQIAIYDLEMEEVKPYNLTYFQLRSRYNPELSYYLVKKENVEELKELLSIKVNFFANKIEDLAIKL